MEIASLRRHRCLYRIFRSAAVGAGEFAAGADEALDSVAAGASGNKNSIFFEVIIMKVAIAKEGDMVSEHFGHCTEYALFVVENSKITSRENLVSPGHEPGKLPGFLAGHKVTHVLAGGMGPRAVDLFCENNIRVFLGVRGKIETVIKDFMAGKIAQGESSCTHGEEGHECSGH
jgi:predicted Fe-Mo cluster-binding NifX family protein